jgi:hypothetical protein
LRQQDRANPFEPFSEFSNSVSLEKFGFSNSHWRLAAQIRGLSADERCAAAKCQQQTNGTAVKSDERMAGLEHKSIVKPVRIAAVTRQHCAKLLARRPARQTAAPALYR